MVELETSVLAQFFAAVIALSILIYVLLDGFDIGVGILFGTTRDEALRHRMMASISPFWDGNETWLIVIGASLFAAFPAVYAVFLGAFYLPVLLLLVALIFRGIAFEFRLHSVGGLRRFWDAGFAAGSVVIAFVQGAAVGAMIRGIPVKDGQFDGTALFWLHPFAVLTGLGLICGYALLGAGWLRMKASGDLRDWASRRIPRLAGMALVILALDFALTLTLDRDAIGAHALADRRWGLIFPALAVLSLGLAARSVRTSRDWVAFALISLFFVCAFATLGVMMWPYMIPYELTVANAAAPEVSLRFLFWGVIVALPMIAIYTIGVYWLFRGKLDDAEY